MSKVYLQDTTLTAIGDAIRYKSGKSDLILPKDMPNEIAKLPSGEDWTIHDGSYLFYNGSRIESHDELFKHFKDLDNMVSMYSGASNLNKEMLDFSKINLLNVTSLKETFNLCRNIKNIKLGKLGKIKSLEAIFYGCSNLESLDIESIDTSECNNIRALFYSCPLQTENIQKIVDMLDTSNVTTFLGPFDSCSLLEELDVSHFNTSNGTDFHNFCQNSKLLRKIDLSNFDMKKATNTATMFSGCSSLETLIIDNENLFPMTNRSMLTGTLIEKGTGYVYVPDNLVEQYKQATNWTTYAEQIKGISELPQGDE